MNHPLGWMNQPMQPGWLHLNNNDIRLALKQVQKFYDPSLRNANSEVRDNSRWYNGIITTILELVSILKDEVKQLFYMNGHNSLEMAEEEATRAFNTVSTMSDQFAFQTYRERDTEDFRNINTSNVIASRLSYKEDELNNVIISLRNDKTDFIEALEKTREHVIQVNKRLQNFRNRTNNTTGTVAQGHAQTLRDRLTRYIDDTNATMN